MGFSADVRAACVTLLGSYRTSANLKLQIYAARPASVNPPTAFVDKIRESIAYIGPVSIQRTPQADVLVVHGTFDSADSADQRDAFVDGFLAYVTGQVHAAGTNTTIGIVEIEDEPTFIPDWLRPELQKTYYATRITLEGFAGE
jgi:hypothetical protein